ncbi:branched-chain amino acid transaminase [Shewanella sp. 1_MG-2023]|uniref:branched-chain amino acid transaminase n=1 Tax=unclassified Shewanella TaxID=196818 RepID=UPI000C821579|nr:MULTISPECIES: branched-chain amino acid transaminase [unclassified Shewanella]MCC4834667.1 branched-chain amino acid transaminase [Shewanella sp. 10N.7]MDO6613575.1 branched-chain amino acid transaminase [Shewanella sp. 7_MG-2023]MDO6773590.1 branched-chain amino acid transaminase [Shewanella sp. 2_MG-2023]MDO6796151.1 branched-chain amino acid transaminase [Shewanella sp. 1_MG-2023]PMG72307.1 branched chain amino acid aminotransferase [Shewanella sp. 10N.286.51.B7]
MAATQSELIWFNGEIMPWQNAKVHVMTHAMHYGTSVFEGIRIYDTHLGPAGFRLTDHVQRLFDSAKIYRMNVPYSFDQVMQACNDSVMSNNLPSAYIRPLIFLGDVGMGITPPIDAQCDMVVAAFAWGAYLGEDSMDAGVDVAVTSWQRLAPNTIPTGAKAGGNYLSSLQISTEAKRNGFDEGIALDTNGLVSEGAGANLFVVKNNKIYTPPATAAILKGITRDTIMVLAKDLGYEVIEEAMAREFLYVADEIFMTGTAAEIVPVRSVDRIEVGAGKRGPVTKQVQSSFFGLFNGETEDKWGWLEPLKKSV